MSQKAWINAYTKGSKSLQAKLAKVHANNPEFQEFMKQHGMGANLSVRQSGLQKKSVATVKPVTDASPEKNVGSREAMIKAAAEKIRGRRLAASNRSAFGGELGGGFQMPGGGFRRYSESVERKNRIAPNRELLIKKAAEKIAKKNSSGNPPDVRDEIRGYSSSYPEGSNFRRYSEEFSLDENKLADKILAHPAVEYYGGADDSHFINLKKGWHMGDGQRSFGSANAREAYKDLKRVVKFKPGEAKEYGLEETVAANFRKVVPGLGKLQAKNRALDLDDKLDAGIKNRKFTRKERMRIAKHIERFARVASGQKAFKTIQKTDEDIAYKDGQIAMYKGGWVAKRDGKRLGTVVPTDTMAKHYIDSTRKSLGQKTMDVLKRKTMEIAKGFGRHSLATESLANRRRIRSWDSAVLPVEHDHPLHTPHPKKKLDALRAAGKHEEARELERSWLRKSMAKSKTENSNE